MPKSIYYDENGNEQILSSSPSALSGLQDTDITTPSAGQVLAYDGSKWANKGVESVTIQSDTTKATVVTVNCWKIGRIVYLRVASITPNTNYSGGERVAYNLPVGIGDDVRVILCDRNTGKSYRFIIDSSGQLVEWYNGTNNKVPSGADLFGSIMYFSAS